MLSVRSALVCATLASTAVRWSSSSSPTTAAATAARRHRKAASAAGARRRPQRTTTASHSAAADDDDTAVAVAAAAANSLDAEVDEVERLLASTVTRGGAPSLQHQQQQLNMRAPALASPVYASQLMTPTGASAASTVVSPSAAVHFHAVRHADAETRSTTGPSHMELERIDRRRSKPSVAEVECETGVTERLLPELPRLAALHEVHYGDAVVCEVDRGVYLAQLEQDKDDSGGGGGTVAAAAAAEHQTETTTAAPPVPVAAGSDAAVVLIDGEPCVELSLDADLSPASFAAFDAEARRTTATSPPDTTTTTTTHTDSASQSGESGGTPGATDTWHADDVCDDDGADGPALQLDFAVERPWFVPPSGVVQLHPLSPEDCALLLRFTLHLRQQTEADLAPSLQRSLAAAEARADVPGGAAAAASRSSPLTLADVVRYLDTAPPPVLALTESLPGNSSSSSSGEAAASPAFVFHLYLENISSQNALGHLATLFSIPQRALLTHTAVSKMSCSTVLCAVAESRVRREHLLLLNTLRYPGFVIRVSDVREVRDDVYNTGATSSSSPPPSSSSSSPSSASSPSSLRLFRELALWQPLYSVEMLLRRVCCDNSGSGSGDVSTRRQLEHRLRAVQTVGAVCFCATREASLARAATDVLHGFFRSALLNALQRRRPPLALTRFLRRPNVVTAQHAHRVSTDATVRQSLKAFMQCNGDWHATVARTPYVWRRRWVNALRGLVWNSMASKRLRKAGRQVCLGDLVLKPEYRHDVHRRGIMTVKAEHVMLVTTAVQAQAACMEDVFLPFLRGRYPEHLFADEATAHPIMTRTNMLATLRAMHAPQLLLGFTDEARLLLDVRADASPMLFRRLLVRPLRLDFAILEDRPPMRALHFDAARLLSNDRWRTAAAASQRTSLASSAVPQQQQQQQRAAVEGDGHLLSPREVLEHTTLGARLSSGVLAEEFFTVPAADDYVVLGHAHRHLAGNDDLVPAAPRSATAAVGDRVYSVYIRAVVGHNLSGLTSLLREYFILSGIETESDSALQHKVHRMRRELDPETALVTAPLYCPTCFSRDHDSQEQCAEYAFKHQRRSTQRDLAAASLESHGEAATVTATAAAGQTETTDGNALALTQQQQQQPSATATAVYMRWRLRRRNDEQRWGVHFTKALHLVGAEDARLVHDAVVWCGAATAGVPDEAAARPWPKSWTAASATPLLRFLHAAAVGDDTGADRDSPSLSLPELLQRSPLLRLAHATAVVGLHTDTNNNATAAAPLTACRWRLAAVDSSTVATQRDVAAALLTHAAKSREVSLTFVSSPPDTAGGAAVHDGHQATDAAVAATSTTSVASLAGHAERTGATPLQDSAGDAAAADVSEAEAWRLWGPDLPHRVSLVLLKRRDDVLARRSWGLQLDGADMTLVNFGALASQFMHPDDASETRHVSVVSLTPSSAFARQSSSSSSTHAAAAAARRRLPITAAAMSLLNNMYRVVRLNNQPVRDKAEAARVMADLHTSLTAATAVAAGGPTQFTLSVKLERKQSSYRAVATPTITAPSPATAPAPPAPAAPATAAAVVVDADVLAAVATVHCPVRPLTAAQLSRSVVTVAINRRVLTEENRSRWGLRLQRGTRRLKAVQEDAEFSFHVFAGKASMGTRIADALRHHSTAASSSTAHHLYYVERVNRTSVRTHAELRLALHAAAQPSAPLATTTTATTTTSALPPESVTLSVRQFALLRMSVVVRRGGVGEESALGPVGLQVDKRMHIVAVFAGGAMARALDTAAGSGCSARLLIRDRDGSGTSESLDAAAPVGATAAATATAAAWSVVLDARLRECAVRLAAAGQRRGAAGQPTGPVARQWRYDLDEDSDGDGGAASTAASTPPPPPHSLAVEEPSELCAGLRALAATAAHTQQQLSKCSMVDGVHLLQAMAMHEFAVAQLAKLDGGGGGEGEQQSAEAWRVDMAALHERVAAAAGAMRWEVVYAVTANRPLRTPADLAAAFAPGIAEETIVLQQCVVE
ncbi:hypothetical protein NESM_000447100 [Novymonas esmeraldas]|uniref:Uncharacterized protein n=1 Tax=Novymonas esmeraldas TaxID=1808958 RepID=A0AAW0EM64_9TRYP